MFESLRPDHIFNDLAQSVKIGLFHVREICGTSCFFAPASSSRLSEPVRVLSFYQILPFLWLSSAVQPFFVISAESKATANRGFILRILMSASWNKWGASFEVGASVLDGERLMVLNSLIKPVIEMERGTLRILNLGLHLPGSPGSPW